MYMKKLKNTYRFRSKVLPDGHLSVLEEIGAATGREFDVTITPIDDVKNSVSLYIEERLKRGGRIGDITLVSECLSRIQKGIRLGDAVILWTLETSDNIDAIITWNTKHFKGKSFINVLTPPEFL